jgi:putative intracellular protease/amidase
MAKVLLVVTAASYWTLKDGTRHPTGYWAEEFAAPYSALSGAGHEVVVSTPGGVVAHVDVMSLRPSMAGSEQFARDLEDILRSAEELRRPIELAYHRLPATVSRHSPTTKKTRSACVKELPGRPRTS